MLAPLLLLALAAAAGAATLAEDVKVVAADGSTDDYFTFLALRGDFLVVGAIFEDTRGSNAGAVYVFRTTDGGASWTQMQKIVDTSGQADDWFGFSVAIEPSGPYLVVGVRNDDVDPVNSGSALFYNSDDGGDTWVVRQRVLGSDTIDGDRFGDAAAIDGDLAAISASYDEHNGADSGAVFVFKTTNGGVSWTEQQKVTSADTVADDHFGRQVAISGDILATSTTRVSGIGALYVFRTSDSGASWTLQQTIIGSTITGGENFGNHMSMSLPYIIVGANTETLNGADSGAAFVFSTSDGGSSWTEKAILTPSDATTSDFFGPCAIDGDTAVVGNVRDGIHSYVFTTTDGWATYTEEHKLTASDGGTSETVREVSINNGLVAVSSRYADGNAVDSGAVYVTRLPAGAVGDPVILDIYGHSFLGGTEPHQLLQLLGVGSDTVSMRTGSVRGRKHGYFLDQVWLDGACGRLVLAAQPNTLDLIVDGDGCMRHRVALGDSGLAIVTLGPDSSVVLSIKAHVSNGFSFLNLKILAGIEQLREYCHVGLMCGELAL